MRNFLKMVGFLVLSGGIFIAIRKGYGYKQAIEKSEFQFRNISKLSINKDLKFSFVLSMLGINPSSQPINVDAIFLDIVMITKGEKLTIASIRKPDYNKVINAKSETILNFKIFTRLDVAGPKVLSKIIDFLKGESQEDREILAVGNLTVEGLNIPVSSSLKYLAA